MLRPSACNAVGGRRQKAFCKIRIPGESRRAEGGPHCPDNGVLTLTPEIAIHRQ